MRGFYCCFTAAGRLSSRQESPKQQIGGSLAAVGYSLQIAVAIAILGLSNCTIARHIIRLKLFCKEFVCLSKI
jgi:hypothetical protein